MGEHKQLNSATLTRRLRHRLNSGILEIWLERTDVAPKGSRARSWTRNRLACLLSNGERAMLMVLDSSDDPGHHAFDELADDQLISGFALGNGQIDEYRACDTVPVEQALCALRVLIDDGVLDARIAWKSDR
jgi:hypothetical protein